MYCGRCGHQFHRQECEACRFDEPPHPPCPVGIDAAVFACQLLDQISRDFRQFLQLAGPVILDMRQRLEEAEKSPIVRLH